MRRSAEDGAARPRVYVHIFHGKDARRYREDYLAGLEPDESPYGFHIAAAEGYDIAFAQDTPRNQRAPLLRLIWRLVGFDIVHAFTNRKRIRAADIVWTMTEKEALAVALLMALRIVPRVPIIASSVWLMSNWHRTSRLRKAMYRWLSRYLSVVTVQSAACLPILREAFPNVRQGLMHFGINQSGFRRAPGGQARDPGPIRVLAAGSDRTRDWPTLLKAIGGDDRFAVKLVCSWVTGEDVAPYPNVDLVHGARMPEFKALYAWADIVVVPMIENAFSGITVALEAAATGTALLSTRTGGVPTYFGDDEAFYVPVGDPIAMRAALLAADGPGRAERAERAFERLTEADYSTRAMALRYVGFTRELLDR